MYGRYVCTVSVQYVLVQYVTFIQERYNTFIIIIIFFTSAG